MTTYTKDQAQVLRNIAKALFIAEIKEAIKVARKFDERFNSVDLKRLSNARYFESVKTQAVNYLHEQSLGVIETRFDQYAM